MWNKSKVFWRNITGFIIYNLLIYTHHQLLLWKRMHFQLYLNMWRLKSWYQSESTKSLADIRDKIWKNVNNKNLTITLSFWDSNINYRDTPIKNNAKKNRTPNKMKEKYNRNKCAYSIKKIVFVFVNLVRYS